MEREEVLLKEYETCQSHTNSIGSQYWSMVGTFIGFTTAFLAVSINFNKPWLTLGLGVAAVIIVCFLWRMLRRIDTIIFSNNFRMREIENELDNVMLKNRTILWLDKPITTPPEHQVRMGRLRAELNHLYEPPARRIACWLFWVASLLWIFFIFIAWWPFIKQLICRS